MKNCSPSLFSALPGDYEDYTPPTIRKENWMKNLALKNSQKKLLTCERDKELLPEFVSSAARG
jgi:hypothetical protein